MEKVEENKKEGEEEKEEEVGEEREEEEEGSLHLFCSRMSTRQVSTLRISAITTAEVAKKRSPGSVRT